MILGIHDGHNATAALMNEGRILCVFSEERLRYKKNYMGFPLYAVKECLRFADVKAEQIASVVFSTKYISINYFRVQREFLFEIRDYIEEQEKYWKPLIYENKQNMSYFEEIDKRMRDLVDQCYDFSDVPYNVNSEEGFEFLFRERARVLEENFNIKKSNIEIYDHHTCHQYYAYYSSPFREDGVVVVTADGGGDGANGTVSIVKNGEIVELLRNNCTDLARIYRYITLLLGMKIGEHEFKVMGLAPYASDYEIRKCDKAFKGIFDVKDMQVLYKKRPKDLYFYFKELLSDCRFDGIAGAVQQMVEEVGVSWFSQILKSLKVNTCVFSGGLAMNVKLNQKIINIPELSRFYCGASAGDESVAIGACYKKSVNNGYAVQNMRNNYLGGCFSNSQILKAISGLKSCRIKENVSVEEVALMLRNGKVIARFAGRMEFGARALGNRSIIADPSNRDVVKKINNQIKFRDFWMPFAPSIIHEFAGKYLINEKNILSDHMTECFNVTDLGAQDLVAALHPYDNTVRAHIVCKEINPDYYNLIKEFQRQTGVGAVLNTSFNLHGYPIVYSPDQAVHVFKNSKLDAMLLENILVIRNND